MATRLLVFQSTLPHGERPGYNRLRAVESYFNPRSRTGSDRGAVLCIVPPDYFNPRSRTGSDVVVNIIVAIGDVFQSTLPHGERPSDGCKVGLIAAISIHAPARGATFVNPCCLLQFREFQSTLPHGERLRRTNRRHNNRHISIHAPARGATGGLYLHTSHGDISIHAPARGATAKMNKISCATWWSNGIIAHFYSAEC